LRLLKCGFEEEWRKSAGLITNEEVLETIGEEKSFISTIKPRQKKWIGHTLRGELLLKL